MSLFGFDFRQHIESLPVISQIVEDNKPTMIVELGTGCGLLTLLMTMGLNNDVAIRTYDIEPNQIAIQDILEKHYDVVFNKADIFKPISFKKILSEIHNEGYRTMVLCDNGSKIKEFNTFAPYLKPDDIIGVHDYFDTKQDFEYHKINRGWRCCEVVTENLNLNNLRQIKTPPYLGWGFWKKVLDIGVD